MKTGTGQIDLVITKVISNLMELAQGLYGLEDRDDARWDYFRKALLRRLNDMRRDVLVRAIEVLRTYDSGRAGEQASGRAGGKAPANGA